jgi:hypothetical protein
LARRALLLLLLLLLLDGNVEDQLSQRRRRAAAHFGIAIARRAGEGCEQVVPREFSLHVSGVPQEQRKKCSEP